MAAESEALYLLRELGAWRLSPQLWDTVAGLLTDLGGAVERDDVVTLGLVITKLEQIAPDRDVRRIGEPGAEPVPPPAPVLDRVSRLIHRLSGDADNDADEFGRKQA